MLVSTGTKTPYIEPGSPWRTDTANRSTQKSGASFCLRRRKETYSNLRDFTLTNLAIHSEANLWGNACLLAGRKDAFPCYASCNWRQ